MAANNYFGFAHGTTQYAAAAGTPAYQAPQAGYVTQTAAAAAAANYTQRAATGYEYQTAAQPATYAVGASGTAAASGYDYTSYARTAPATAAYDTSKSYYQQGATAASQAAYTSTTDYQGKTGGAYTAAYTSQPSVRPAATQHKAAVASTQYSTGYTSTQPQAQAATYTYSTPVSIVNQSSTTGGSFNGSTVSYTNSTATTNYTTAYPTQQTAVQTTPAQKPKAAVYSGAMYMNQGGAANAVVSAAAGGGGGSGAGNKTTNTTWQGYKKTTGVKQMRPKPTPKPQQLHYCEVCKISCAGPQTYREHLEGQRHKKKEQLQKEGGVPAGAGRGQNNLRCELCDVVCTGSDAYAAHLRGAKHLKVVKLHTRLGKPIPEVDVKAAKAAAVAASASPATGGAAKNISFIQSGTLGTVKSGESKETEMKDESSVAAANSSATSGSNTLATDVEMLTENEITPVGQEYIEEVKNEEGKLLSFVCKLCECKFNDPNAKDMHMKGRRHRLQFKKKVNPDLVVDVKPSGRRSRIQEEKNKRREAFMWRREDDRSFWTDRLDDRIYWEERRRFEEEVEYIEWMRRRGPAPPPGPNFMQPVPPFAMRRPETIDDRHIIVKHQAIFPKDDKLQIIHKMANQVEKAIRTAAEQIGPKLIELIKKDTVTSEKTGTDKKPEDKNDDKETGRFIRGVMRVGILAKNLILSDDSVVQLVILCNDWPTKPVLQQLYSAFQAQMKVSCAEENYSMNLSIPEACFSVATTCDPKVQVIVSMTSPVVRELLLKEGEASGSSLVKNEEALDQAKCLEALAQLRRAKWFQARPGNNPSSVMVIRILRDLCSRNPTWAPLTDWACELLVDRVVGCVAFSGSEALRKVLEAVAGGVLLPSAPGIADPCERDPTDASAELTMQQRADITASAQHALRLFAFRQIHKVLGIPQIMPAPRHAGNRPHMQRFNRKRRRDHSAGENQDSEGADGKKDKRDGGDVVMTQAK